MANYGGAGGLITGGGTGGGTPGGGGARSLTPVVIPAGMTMDVDVIATPSVKRFLYYYLLLEQAVTVKVTSVVIHGVNNGVLPVHSCPSEVGDIQAYVTDLGISAGSLRLRITNNEANSITVSGRVVET